MWELEYSEEVKSLPVLSRLSSAVPSVGILYVPKSHSRFMGLRFG